MNHATPLVLAVAAGSIYAIADAGHTGGKNVVKIMAASVAVGFVGVALDDVTNGPLGTGLTALFLFAAFLNKGANATVLASKLVTNFGKPAVTVTQTPPPSPGTKYAQSGGGGTSVHSW